VNHKDDLIDTAEMYLRSVLELEEEGVVPRRARIAERLGHSAPAVSQMVARMERDGLLTLTADRQIKLTPAGRSAAIRVMRKHRLAECLLVSVLGLEWHVVHDEACRWEHVMSDAVERRLLEVLGHPAQSPYGNPIPGLAELGEERSVELPGGVVPLTEVPAEASTVVVRRIGESLQSDTALLTRLRDAGLRPDAPVAIARVDGGVRIGTGPAAAEIGHAAAAHIFVAGPGDVAAVAA
jgi:DtxR family transcriptional regulator, Mn-dependent transcriptional regulator